MKEIYKALAEIMPKEAVQEAKKEDTKKGYDTTGFGYQYIVNRFNDILGIDGWGYDYHIIKENTGNFKSGQPFFEITVEMDIWVNTRDNIRRCVGGHISSSYFDALKGAITNAFKKTAAFFGVGRQAFEGSIDDDAAYEDVVRDYRPSPPPTTPKKPEFKNSFLETMKLQAERVGADAYFKVIGGAGFEKAADITDPKTRMEVYNELTKLPNKKEVK